MITYNKYKKTRHWAIYLHGELICLTVYKKGAERVQEILKGNYLCVAEKPQENYLPEKP